MRLPAVAITVLFLIGIALGLQPFVAPYAISSGFIFGGFALAATLLLAGLFLARFDHLSFAACATAFCWITLGLLASSIAQQPLPENHVLSLLAAKRLALNTPLRWHGHLRDEPSRLPWGYGYDVDISGVEFGGNFVNASGGLRIDYSPKPNDISLPAVHAGDEIALLAQAKLPRIYRDDGAFDRRGYLAEQNIHLVATLRAPELLECVNRGRASPATIIAKLRHRLREEVDILFPRAPQFSATLRAMLLGDRTFIDRSESVDFQKTGVFHVLVVAGLHVGALAVFLFWLGRRLRIPRSWSMVLMLFVSFFYVSIVEQRPPVLRAALMAAIVVIGGFFYRRLDLLNSAAIAALLLLIARPLAIRDTSFQLSFLAIFCIAGVAVPWLDNTLQPYVRALRGWRDVSRDIGHEPLQIQFRIDLRLFCAWISSRLSPRLGRAVEIIFASSLVIAFRVMELLALTFVLQVGMLPLMARDFHRIPLLGLVVNLLAVPLTAVIVPLGFIAIATGLIFSSVAKVFAVPLYGLLWLLTHAVGWFAAIPGASYRIPGPPPWLIFVFFLSAVFFVLIFRWKSISNKWPLRMTLASMSVAVILIATSPFAPRRAAGQLELTALDVGQGDSLFMVSPAGRTMLIDGGGAFQGFPGHEEHLGPDPGEDIVSPYLWSRGFQTLDVVALTHAHQDHLGGLAAILRNFHVGKLWLGREAASAGLAMLEKIAQEHHIPIEYETKGQHFSWDGAIGTVLWPEISEQMTGSAKNDDSLVFRMQYGDRSFLLPGDAEKQSEFQMLGQNETSALQSDVLKVGHHGSKNSTMPQFLSAVHPSIALISAGEDNPYGHPSPELLSRLQESGVRILRTDRDGALQVLTDGKQIAVSCFIPCVEAQSESTQTQTPDSKQESQQ
jgi:competence protein ComEC